MRKNKRNVLLIIDFVDSFIFALFVFSSHATIHFPLGPDDYLHHK